MTSKQIEFRLTLPSNPRQIGRVEKFLKKVQGHVALDEIQFHKLMVSLTEAVNNAILHGNKQDETKKVKVKCEVLPGWLLFVVEDEGGGFDITKVKNPLNEENLLRDSGRGIFLMKTLMDRVEYGNTKKGVQVLLWLDLGK